MSLVSKFSSCQTPRFLPVMVRSFHSGLPLHKRLPLPVSYMDQRPRPLFGSVSTRTLYGSARVDLSGLVTPIKEKFAQYLVEPVKLPEEALFAVFVKNMRTLENETSISFSLETKKWLWTAVSEEPLKILRETLVSEFSQKILLEFSDAQIKKMSNLQTETDLLTDKDWLALRDLLVMHRISIADILLRKAFSLNDSLNDSMIEALKSRGISPIF